MRCLKVVSLRGSSSGRWSAVPSILESLPALTHTDRQSLRLRQVHVERVAIHVTASPAVCRCCHRRQPPAPIPPHRPFPVIGRWPPWLFSFFESFPRVWRDWNPHLHMLQGSQPAGRIWQLLSDWVQPGLPKNYIVSPRVAAELTHCHTSFFPFPLTAASLSGLQFTATHDVTSPHDTCMHNRWEFTPSTPMTGFAASTEHFAYFKFRVGAGGRARERWPVIIGPDSWLHIMWFRMASWNSCSGLGLIIPWRHHKQARRGLQELTGTHPGRDSDNKISLFGLAMAAKEAISYLPGSSHSQFSMKFIIGSAAAGDIGIAVENATIWSFCQGYRLDQRQMCSLWYYGYNQFSPIYLHAIHDSRLLHQAE